MIFDGGGAVVWRPSGCDYCFYGILTTGMLTLVLLTKDFSMQAVISSLHAPAPSSLVIH